MWLTNKKTGARFNTDWLKDKQIKQSAEEASKRNEKVNYAKKHKEAVAELGKDKYPDYNTYDVDTKKIVSFTKGYQVTFCQIGDNYTDDEYNSLVEKFLNESSDGRSYGGKFEGTPEISFHFNDRNKAIQFAKDYNQISVWDWGNDEEIKTGGTGRRK